MSPRGKPWGRLIWFGFVVFNATFNNISTISWLSVLLVEETGVPGENDRPVTDKFYHIMMYRAHLACAGFKLTTLVVIDTDYIGSLKSNNHTITTAPLWGREIKTRFPAAAGYNPSSLAKGYDSGPPSLHPWQI
jgi:hypothetical protein